MTHHSVRELVFWLNAGTAVLAVVVFSFAVLKLRDMLRLHLAYKRSRELCSCKHARHLHTSGFPFICNVPRCPCMKFEEP